MGCLCGNSTLELRLKHVSEDSPFGTYLDSSDLDDLAAAFVCLPFKDEQASLRECHGPAPLPLLECAGA